ncbi:odorant receptor 4 [Monomorium pharaonis]|uniref:odorant receptor 4 n=1 Tax=Monomorium pharaonis TaxID=307658 RepID=UPI001745D957|nr:odorant receptor 4 [Monomorium pharaonis]
MNKTIITETAIPVAIIYDHKKDMQLSIQLNRWILKPLGAWPKSAKISRTERYVYALVNVICVSLIGFLFVPSAIFMVLEMDDMYNILKLFGPLNFCIMNIIKYLSLIFRGNDIRSGIEHIESDWMNTRHNGDREIMIRNAKFGRHLVSICAFFMYGGVVFYYFALPFSTGKITENDGNLTYRPLVYPVAKMIVDTRHSPISEIFFWVQFLSGFIVHSINAGASSLAAAFAMHAYGRLEVLIQWIEHFVDGREDLYDNVNERLAMIVQQHVRILNFISLMDKILREISILEVVGCTISMCLLGYYFVMEWKLKNATSYVTYIVLYTSLTFNIFIYCYIGELVAEKCKEIGEMSYMTEWHRLSGKKSLGLILMIAMSNTSVKLTAGNIFELSLSTFSDARQDWRDTVDWRNRKAMLFKAKIGRKFAIFSAIFMYVGGLSYRTIVPLSKGRMLTPMNTTVRALACPSYFVKFDEQATPAYEIVFTLQFFAGLLTYSITVGAAGLAAFFVLHGCGQLKVLIDKIQRINDILDADDRTVVMLLADIVEHQIKVKNFLKEVERAMRYVLLVEIVGCTLLLCLTGYYIIMEWENSDSTAMLTMTVILTSFVISIFTNCYVGQLLTDQSIKVGSITSTTNWYRLPYKKARGLILIMAISNIPAKITAGKMMEMSLPTFSNIVKTAVAYFNLLRKFM